MKQLITRTITGTVFVALTIGSILLDPFCFAGIFLVFCAISLWEFYRFFIQAEVKPQRIAGMFAGIFSYTILTLVARHVIGVSWILLLIPIISLPFVIELYRKKNHPFQNIAITLLPVLYIAIPFAMLNFLFNPWYLSDGHYPNILLGFFFIIWCGDIMAYLGGSVFGRHPLFERISPKKSWEGSIVGALFSLGMAWFLSLFLKELTILQWLGMAVIIVVAGTFGDLIESMLKRSAQVKDSGSMLPGHGGVLDRFDCVLLAAPLVFLYLNLINKFL